jgi:predicted ATPase
LLLLATARPELLDRRPSWGGGRRNAAQLLLEPLSLEEAAHMLEELLGSELPARLRRLVLDNAEGNPFFVEELVAALIDRGFLARKDGRWQLGDLPPRFEVPDSVQSVLAARIDLLGAAEKAALQAASVVGRVFWAGPVIELLGGVEADLGVLVERDFIRRRPASSMAGEREFGFKHAVTRDVAYEGLPKARRAHLHAAVADWIERLGEGRDEHAPLLAHHYAEAVKPEDLDLAWPGEEVEAERLRVRATAWLR